MFHFSGYLNYLHKLENVEIILIYLPIVGNKELVKIILSR